MYAEYNNSIEEDEISLNLKKIYNNNNNNNNIINNHQNIQPNYNNYYNQQSGFCNMSFGSLINKSNTSTIIIPVNADLEYDSDCKMGYNTTLLIPVTVPAITQESSVVIIPNVTQQKIDNNNIVNSITQQKILEAKIEDNKIVVNPINDISQISEKSQVITTVTNINESENKIEATTITSLPIKIDENKKVVTESNIVNIDTSGSNVKTNSNIVISQLCLNGTIQCDVQQQINNIKSDTANNYNIYSQSSRTIVDLSSGNISLYGKNDTQNITTIPTQFIDISKNTDISKNIMLVNDDNSLKVNIPINSPTIVKTNDSGEHINTTTNPIIINTKEPNTVTTILERFENGYTITPVVNKDRLPPINIPVHTRYM
jgi:hypothetical protein